MITQKKNEQKAKDHRLSKITKFRKAENIYFFKFLILSCLGFFFWKPLIYYSSLDI